MTNTYSINVGSHTHSFSGGTWTTPPPTLTRTETTAEKVRRERVEKAERERLEAAYAALDALDLIALPEGAVLRFTGHTAGNERTYAALWVDDRWFVTGRESPNGAPTEDFLAWLIERGVAAEQVERL